MSLQRAQENIFEWETQHKKNTTTRDKSMTILIVLLKFGEKNNTSTIFFFHLRFLMRTSFFSFISNVIDVELANL